MHSMLLCGSFDLCAALGFVDAESVLSSFDIQYNHVCTHKPKKKKTQA